MTHAPPERRRLFASTRPALVALFGHEAHCGQGPPTNRYIHHGDDDSLQGQNPRAHELFGTQRLYGVGHDPAWPVVVVVKVVGPVAAPGSRTTTE